MKHVRLRMTLYSERFFFHVKSSLYPLPLWWKKRGRFGFWKLWLLRYLSASFSHCKKLHTKMALQNIVCLWINISISASIFLCDYRRYIKLLSVHRTLNILYTDGVGMLQKWECMQFWWMDVLRIEEKKKTNQNATAID